LVEAVILELLAEQQDEAQKTGTIPLAAGKVPLPMLAEQVITGMVIAYRQRAGLLRAMREFVEVRANSAFREKAGKFQLRYFERLLEMFLLYRRNIRHPHPRRAVALGLKMLVGTLYELVVWPAAAKDFTGLLPKDDQALQQELTRAFLSYLGVEV
jgi:hypothetical protein